MTTAHAFGWLSAVLLLADISAAAAEDETPSAAAASPAFPEPVLQVHHQHPVSVVAYSPDGKLLAVGGGRETVSLYDARTAEHKTTLKLRDENEEAARKSEREIEIWPYPLALAFSPDSNLLAVGCLGGVKLFDARTGELSWQLRPAHGLSRGVAFSPDGNLLATCGGKIDLSADGVLRLGLGPIDGLLMLWDVKTGEPTHDLQGEHNSEVHGVVFSPDGKRLASAGHWTFLPNDRARTGDEFAEGTGAKLWDPQTAKVVKVFAIPGGHLKGESALSLAFSPDCKRLAIGIGAFDITLPDDSSGAISVFSTESATRDLHWLVPRAVWQVAFSADGKTIAALSGVHRLTLWDPSTGSIQGDLRVDPTGPFVNGVTGPLPIEKWENFAINPATHWLAVGGTDGEKHGIVTVWDLCAVRTAAR